MKKQTVITLGVLVLAGGFAGAVARAAGPFFNNVGAMDYELHEQFTNAPRFAYTANLPVLTNTDLESLSGALFTDGSGRIAGLVYARVFFDGPSNHTNNYGAFTLTVTGNTSNRGTNPWVRLAIHGNGYTFDGVSNHPNASVSLNFNSTNRLVDVPAAAPVTVTNTNGTSSATTATVVQAAPAFFLWASKYAVATRQDYSYAVAPGTIPGLTTVAAKPGDVLILWTTGLGLTSPPVPAGIQVPGDQLYATFPVKVTIGTAEVQVYGSALAPGFVGLYQVAIQVPDNLADGEYPIKAIIGGVSSPDNVFLSVQH